MVLPCIRRDQKPDLREVRGAVAERGEDSAMGPTARATERDHFVASYECGAGVDGLAGAKNVETTGWEPPAGASRRPDGLLDPFDARGPWGSCGRLQRDAILIEISPEYAEMARARIQADATLLADVEVVA